MGRLNGRVLVILVLALWLMACSAQVGQAALMDTAFTYQGRLIDNNDVADGLYDFQFRLFDGETDGNQLGLDVNEPEVDVIDGYFTVELDFGSSVFDGDARWLKIGVRPGTQSDPCEYTTLSPWQEVTAVPYALYAKTAGDDNDWRVSGNDIYSIPSGNVGIGISTPGYKLHIEGKVISGLDNNAPGTYAAIAGGRSNNATGGYTAVGGGWNNDADDHYATVGGGNLNKASGNSSTVGGGAGNTASGWEATVSGGNGNTASGNDATIGGGLRNSATFTAGIVGGGYENIASGGYATVGGGYQNTAGSKATVPGGIRNSATGSYSFAAGRRAKANHQGGFVWADSTDADFVSTGNDQFIIRASGGVGIGTTGPLTKFHVYESSSSDVFVSVEASDSNAEAGVRLKNPAGGWDVFVNDGNGDFGISHALSNRVLTIKKTTGNVGIGTENPQGVLDVNGPIYQRGGVLHADYVFELDYQLETIDDHSQFMWQNNHLPAIPKAQVDATGREIVEVGSHRRGIVEELEKAHIYIEQLHKRNNALEERVAALEKMFLQQQFVSAKELYNETD